MLRAPRLLLLAALAVACARDEPPPRPDVILLDVDTLRADHCSVYGYPRPTTPELERIARGGVAFTTTYTATSSTCPAHATLFTSRYPLAHGVVRNGLVLPEGERTLAEVLHDAGWATAAFVSSFAVSHGFGFAQGFERFDDAFEADEATLDLQRWGDRELGEEQGFDRKGRATTRAALDWLKAGGAGEKRPLFLWVHYFDPHAPYDPPRRILRRFPPVDDAPEDLETARYDAEIATADEQIGRLLEGLAAARPDRPRLIVVVGDHGEGLGDHGWGGHGRHTYEEEVRVPLLLRWDGVLPAGLRVETPVHLADVLPTLLALLGLPDGAPLAEGLDQSALARGEAPPGTPRPLFLQRPLHEGGRPELGEAGPGYGVRLGRWKLYLAPEEGRHELYDLDADPDERHDLSARDPREAAKLAALIDAWVADQREHTLGAAPSEAEGAAEGLRALGYVGYGTGDGATGASTAEDTAPDAGEGAAAGDG